MSIDFLSINAIRVHADSVQHFTGASPHLITTDILSGCGGLSLPPALRQHHEDVAGWQRVRGRNRQHSAINQINAAIEFQYDRHVERHDRQCHQCDKFRDHGTDVAGGGHRWRGGGIDHDVYRRRTECGDRCHRPSPGDHLGDRQLDLARDERWAISSIVGNMPSIAGGNGVECRDAECLPLGLPAPPKPRIRSSIRSSTAVSSTALARGPGGDPGHSRAPSRGPSPRPASLSVLFSAVERHTSPLATR